MAIGFNSEPDRPEVKVADIVERMLDNAIRAAGGRKDAVGVSFTDLRAVFPNDEFDSPEVIRLLQARYDLAKADVTIRIGELTSHHGVSTAGSLAARAIIAEQRDF